MPPRRPLWPIIRRVWITCGALAFVIFVGWSLLAYRSTPAARRALVGDSVVEVTRGASSWSFRPRSAPPGPGAGLLFFSGALVDPVAYAPLLRGVAREGYPVLLVALPRRGAFGGADDGTVLRRARAAMRGVPEVPRWVAAGHSKGGVVAARMAHEDPAGLAGLVLVGTSHPRDFSLADLTLPVTKVLGTRDGIAELEKSERNRHLLPAATRWVLLEGGNHSQFGHYGFQPGDRFAVLSRDRQQELTLQAVLEALRMASR